MRFLCSIFKKTPKNISVQKTEEPIIQLKTRPTYGSLTIHKSSNRESTTSSRSSSSSNKIMNK